MPFPRLKRRTFVTLFGGILALCALVARVPSLLDAAEGVVKQGVPLNHALTVLSKVQDRCRSVAKEFVRLFLEDVWKPFEEAGYPDERWP